ncbi:MAG TPA: histidine phosphatase family protein, partial [Rectinemataceae bacterium]|nr:histidine phosphatase family protein [Rectinemataceae bacterium]
TGAFEFGEPEDLAAKYPEVWREYGKTADRTDFKYPDGESGEEVFARIDEFFKLLEQDGRNCLVATHDGWIRLAMCRVLSLPASARFFFSVETCGITELERGQNGWRVIRFNYFLE